MKIENTAYYISSTAFFRREPYSSRTEFGEDGFTYIGRDLALGFRRASKSNYEITVMFGGDVAQVIKHSIAEAAEFAAHTVRRAEQ